MKLHLTDKQAATKAAGAVAAASAAAAAAEAAAVPALTAAAALAAVAVAAAAAAAVPAVAATTLQGQGVGYSVAVMAARVAYLAYTQSSFNRAALLLLQQLPAA